MPLSALHWFSMFFMNFKKCEGQPCMSFITNVLHYGISFAHRTSLAENTALTTGTLSGA
jgi:hypothetical protein